MRLDTFRQRGAFGISVRAGRLSHSIVCLDSSGQRHRFSWRSLQSNNKFSEPRMESFLPCILLNNFKSNFMIGNSRLCCILLLNYILVFILLINFTFVNYRQLLFQISILYIRTPFFNTSFISIFYIYNFRIYPTFF